MTASQREDDKPFICPLTRPVFALRVIPAHIDDENFHEMH